MPDPRLDGHSPRPDPYVFRFKGNSSKANAAARGTEAQRKRKRPRIGDDGETLPAEAINEGAAPTHEKRFGVYVG